MRGPGPPGPPCCYVPVPIRSSTRLRFFFLISRLQAEDSNRMYHGFNNRPRGGQKSCPEGRLCYPPGGSHQCLDLPQCQGHARRQCQRCSYNILFSNPREFLMLSFRNRDLRICVTKVTTDVVFVDIKCLLIHENVLTSM